MKTKINNEIGRILPQHRSFDIKIDIRLMQKNVINRSGNRGNFELIKVFLHMLKSCGCVSVVLQP